MIEIKFISAESVPVGESLGAILLTGMDAEGREHQWMLPAESASGLASSILSETSPGKVASSAGKEAAERPSKGADQRRAERHQYHCTQLIAPYRGDIVPKIESFREVVCHDLSATGFSFFSPTKPEFDSLIVMMMGEGGPTYLAAKVVHSREGYWDGAKQFLVGCQFIGRLAQAP